MALPEASLASVAGAPYYIDSLNSSSGSIWPSTPASWGQNKSSLTRSQPSYIVPLESTNQPGADNLAAEAATWWKHDDLFISVFLRSIYILVKSTSVLSLDYECKAVLESRGTEKVPFYISG